MLGDALGQWADLSVVPDERLYPALRRRGLRPGAVMDLGRLREVAGETGGWTVVIGEVLGVGERIRVSARAYDIITGRQVVRVTADAPAAGGMDVRGAYETIATALLRFAGLGRATADLEAATTPSLEAYRAYLDGMARLNKGEYRHARSALLEAVTIDSTFAQAYAKLAEVSLLAFSVLDPRNPAYGYASRAMALSARLPARAAAHVRVLHSLLNADFVSARRDLERLVAEDSNDVDALESLASLEFLDPQLVMTPGGEVRRGSLNAAIRLAERVLDLDPPRHGAYQGLVAIYSLAAGQLPGAVAGYRRDLPRPVRSSVRAWCSCDFELSKGTAGDSVPREALVPDQTLVPVLKDSLVLVPLEALTGIPAESLRAARNRALVAAQTWAWRWVAAAPSEAEAHWTAARVSELAGDIPRALHELDLADSLGLETEAEAVPARRMILVGKLGRIGEADRIADSLWNAGYFGGDLFATVPAMTEAYAWATNLFAAEGDFTRVRPALAAFSARLALHLEPDRAYSTTLDLLAGSGTGPSPAVSIPAGLRRLVQDSLTAELARAPGDPLLGRWLRILSGP